MKKLIATLAMSLFSMAAAMAVTLTVTWPANPANEGVSSYNLYVSTNGAPYVLLTNVATTSHVIADPATGVYGFKVAALNIAGEGNTGVAASSPSLPSFPVGGTASATNNTITVNWTPNAGSQYVTSYNVYISTNGLPLVLGQSVVAPPAVFADLDPAVYSFRVSAVNLAGESSQSALITGPGLPSTGGTPTVAVTP